MASTVAAQQDGSTSAHDRLLFIGCFIALITTSFGFILRALTLKEWGVQFALTETQKGEIFGAGLWPFAISIVLFSLVIDKVGYGKAMVFAFLCHLVSIVMTVRAQGYWDLYWANFVVALGNGPLNKDTGERLAFTVKKGDTVLFSSYAGTEVKISDDTYLIMTEEDILGVIE